MRRSVATGQRRGANLTIETTAQGSTENRFRAFVSYSHADKAAAQKLHRKLEGYRLPKHLRDAAKGLKSDGRVGAVFRDREDLPAAEDLTESVKQALQASEALIVLCSPNAQKSPWVAREIELFRQLHPGRPVLAALLEGEPDEAFPAPLREGREPLAADLRKNGDGPRLGFLKVVAGVAGVPLDALINRDAQRRVKRVTAVTVAAVAAMVVMALMTTFAIQQRNEAQAQQAAANGLIDYMITDLRADLKGVGRLEIMDGVNSRAMQFFTDQGDLSTLTDSSLQNWAVLLHALGEDEEKAGNLPDAANRFAQAYRATGEILARSPNDADRLFAHAQSAYWVGYASWQAGRFDDVTGPWAEYLSLAKRLAAAEPQSARSFMELGYSHGNMCELSMKRGASKAALNHCLKAIESMTKATLKEPEKAAYASSLGNRYGWLADVHLKRAEFEDALTARQREAQIIERLAAERSDDTDLRLRSVYPRLGMAEIELTKRNGSAALPHLESVISLLDALARNEPDDRHVTALQIKAMVFLARSQFYEKEPQWRATFADAKTLYSRTVSAEESGPVARMKTTVIEHFEKEIEDAE